MSDLSSALAAALQNHATIGPMISGVISGRNFDLQDEKINTAPYACIAVIDLPSRESFFLGGDDSKVSGQIEIRCVSSISEDKAKEMAEEVKIYLRATSAFTWDGGSVAFNCRGWLQYPDTSDDLETWLEILTIDFTSIA